jgi:serine/threonine protein kinase
MQPAPEPGTHPLVGQVIAGKFRVNRVLAEGGMGFVVAATHLHLDQPVAVKLPRGEIIANSEALARFTREAKAAAQLKSEYVARVLDAGVSADGPYMVMEYLEGHSLARLLELQGRLDLESAAEYAIQVCEGLAEAHARGIVHRDVKPDNLFLVERSPGWQIVKLLDFGISKISFAEKGNLKTSIIMGSPCYMSPEQLRSTATVDHRTDLWSLGATLYELLAGVGPFDGSQPLADLFVSILERPAQALRELRPEVPEALAAIVARCLEKDRDARFQSAGEVAMELLPFAPPRARVAAERAVSMPDILRRSRAGAERTALAVEDAPGSEGDGSESLVDEAWDSLSGPSREVTLDEGSPQIPPVANDPVAQEAPSEPRAEQSSAPAVTAPPPSVRRSFAASAWRSSVLGLPYTTIATGGAALLLAAALVLRPHAPSAPSVPMVVTPAGVAASLAPAPDGQRAAVAPPTSELFVRASPASAKLTIDGVPVSGNPFHARYPKNEVHVLGVAATGYEAKYEPVSLGNDVFIDVSLDPRPTMATRSSSPAAVARPRRVAPPAPQAEPIPTAVAASSQPTLAPAIEVDPAGGHTVLHPIEATNPYGAP